MTSDELERAIDFLLKSGARCDARIEQTNEQLARLSEKVDRISEKVDRLSDDFAQLSSRQDSFADTQANIMRVMTQTFDRQADINNSLSKSIREGNEALRESIRESHESMQKENEARRKENEALGAYIREVAAAGAETDRRLNAFIAATERGRDAGQ